MNLGGWLADFDDPTRAPNYAVCLYQMPHFNDSAGVQISFLLKSCVMFGGQTRLVKVGMYFTKDRDIKNVTVNNQGREL